MKSFFGLSRILVLSGLFLVSSLAYLGAAAARPHLCWSTITYTDWVIYHSTNETHNYIGIIDADDQQQQQQETQIGH
jgi:hypothetical protein